MWRRAAATFSEKAMKSEAQKIVDLHGIDRVRAGEAGTCQVCGRVVSAYVPKGGDGSLVKVRCHNRDAGGGTLRRERCPGSGEPAKECVLRQ
jgi:hypothetical protein